MAYTKTIAREWVAKLLSAFTGAISTTSTLAATGAATLGSTLAVTGAITPTGGVVGTTMARVANIPLGPVALASIGTDAVGVAGTLYYSEIWLPCNKTCTGAGILNGTSVGTDSVIYALANAAGTVVATTALAGTLGAGADTYQQIAFTTPYAAVGPAKYWLIYQVNGTAHATQRIAASTYRNLTGSAAGVFGTLASITPPTSTTADVGPIGYVYT